MKQYFNKQLYETFGDEQCKLCFFESYYNDTGKMSTMLCLRKLSDTMITEIITDDYEFIKYSKDGVPYFKLKDHLLTKSVLDQCEKDKEIARYDFIIGQLFGEKYDIIK